MSSTLLLFDGFDTYDAASALSAAGKWGGLFGTPTFVTGRHGTPWKAISFASGGQSVTANFPASAIIRVGFAFKRTTSSSERILSLLRGSDGGALFTLMSTIGINTIRMMQGDTFHTQIASSVANLGVGIWHWCELVVEQGAAGKVAKLWINGLLAISFTGQTTFSADNFVAIKLGGTDLQIDDVAVWSESDTAQALKGDSRVVPFYPTSDAVLDAGWVPSTGVDGFAVVDDTEPAGDSDTLDCSTVAAVAAFASTDTLPTNPATIHGVQVTVRGLKSDSGTRSVKPLLRIAATNYLGAEAFLAVGLGDYYALWETNPNTAAAWTKAGVEGADFGVKLES